MFKRGKYCSETCVTIFSTWFHKSEFDINNSFNMLKTQGDRNQDMKKLLSLGELLFYLCAIRSSWNCWNKILSSDLTSLFNFILLINFAEPCVWLLTKLTFLAVVKENMLIILGHLLSMVPSEVQSRELPPLLPLLFEGIISSQKSEK